LKARNFNLIKIGGKQDDITIISAFIQQKKTDSFSFIENKEIFDKKNTNYKNNNNNNNNNQGINYSEYDLGISILISNINDDNLNSLKEI